MGGPRVAHDQLKLVLKTYEQYKTHSESARQLGMARVTFARQLEQAQLLVSTGQMSILEPAEFEIARLPDENISTDVLIARRKESFAQKRAAKLARKLIPVKVNIEGPFGIAHLGDPHVDDDGTDIGLLEAHTKIIKTTHALFGANVGDITNNWVGRLARLYGEQSTSARDAWQLADWLVHTIPWMYIVGGNHDVWSGEGDPLKWITHQANVLYQWHGVRLNLMTPNGRSFRVNARHDFKGHSMWNVTHGPAKAVQMGWRDHVLTCGHKHESGYQILKDPASGLISHVIRVGSYKTFDRYAEEKQLPDQTFTVAPVTIFDPAYADDDARAITVIMDPEEAASYLTWKRKRARV